ncbi:hypothetical protein SteCoe_4443 [Stentor coeruleus]|uniref:Uncharacterized protein n=1 Tax=Stentor coeruleus TaxID=5963 RepID=A0A1R2CUN0_9CILI|nr:hypothetical protein SteCoe_4443 [Stentor coeruleus]
MGCCSSQNPVLAFGHRALISEVEEDLKNFVYSSNGSPTTINDPIAILDGVTLNPLAYALWCGRFKTFKTLKESMGANIEDMESLLEKQNLSGLEIIMKKGYIDLLNYYLHEFLLNCNRKIEDIEILKKPLLQISVANGHVNIVNYVYTYFIHVCPPPAFDVHYVDPKTGENCALIACKHCNFPMVRYLNETCGVDFSIKNAKNQSALQLAVKSARKGLGASDFIMYLIEKCNVDITHEYEEIVEMIEDQKLIEYLKNALSGIGISSITFSKTRTYSSSILIKDKKIEESQITIGAMSSISFIDPTNYLTFSLLQEEN